LKIVIGLKGEISMVSITMNPDGSGEEKQATCIDQQPLMEVAEESPVVNNEESNPQPQSSHQMMVNSSNSNPMAFMNMGGLGAMPAVQLQAQHQMMLMAQMLRMNQLPLAVGSQGNASASHNSQHGMAELVKLQQQQQQAQMNLLQSMSMSQGGNPMGMNPSQQQMNQFLLAAGIGGNMGQGFYPGNFRPLRSDVPKVASIGSTPSDSNNTAANKRSQAEDDMNDPGWEDQYKALQRYRLVNGHTKVPARYKVSQR
jgi:hypothetical protein